MKVRHTPFVLGIFLLAVYRINYTTISTANVEIHKVEYSNSCKIPFESRGMLVKARHILLSLPLAAAVRHQNVRLMQLRSPYMITGLLCSSSSE